MLQNNKNNFLRNLKSKLQYLNYSDNTIKIYCHYANEFLDSLNCNPSKISSNDFQSYLDSYKFTSISQQNQIISAIKFLYEKVLNKKYSKIDFERPRKEKKLPRIIDKTHLLKSIKKIENLKHKAIISLSASVGLRVSEVINLKIEDIDSKRMIIIQGDKFFKDLEEMYHIASANNNDET